MTLEQLANQYFDGRRETATVAQVAEFILTTGRTLAPDHLREAALKYYTARDTLSVLAFITTKVAT